MLYNLYRPTDFSEVKGQEDVLVTMKRQAQTGKFGHAYLLAGHRGTGKTTIARILSKAINCENPTENGPCKVCESCLAAKSSMDIKELDAATNNGVDHIKELTGQTKYRPVQLKNKVFIIDEVHNLSTAAFDVLLKPLEEPPSYCTFILCTTELHKIPVTIRSRCETYTFHPISPVPMKERLKEVLAEQNATCEEDALNLIVRNAKGGMRDALGILEQLMAGTDGAITAEAAKKQLGVLDTDAVLDTLSSVIGLDTAASLSSMESLLSGGRSPSLIAETALRALTDMITMKSTGNRQSVMHSRDYIETIWKMGQEISFNRLYWLCEQFCDLRMAIRGSADPALDLRLALIRLSHQEIISSDTVKLADEISMLKQEIAQLKAMVRQNPAPPVQTDIQKDVHKDICSEDAEASGFRVNPDISPPFENTEPGQHTDLPEDGADMPKEDTDTPKEAQQQAKTGMEGGMQTDREEAEEFPADNTPEVKKDDISASDLFKILR